MNDFIKVLQDLIEVFVQLTGIAQVKLEAASGDRAATVEECMNKEQAMVLRLRGLEKERQRTQAETGYGTLSFREILEQADEEQRDLLLPVFDELSRQIQMYQEVSEDAAQVLNIKLHQLKQVFDIKGNSTYTDNGGAAEVERHMTNRIV